jgi:hypothetical protein
MEKATNESGFAMVDVADNDKLERVLTRKGDVGGGRHGFDLA